VLQVHVFVVFFTSRLKKFFFDAGNMAYVKALVHVPVLPQVWSSILSALIFPGKEGCFEIYILDDIQSCGDTFEPH